jgi:hypothetical protein
MDLAGLDLDGTFLVKGVLRGGDLQGRTWCLPPASVKSSMPGA